MRQFLFCCFGRTHSAPAVRVCIWAQRTIGATFGVVLYAWQHSIALAAAAVHIRKFIHCNHFKHIIITM